MDKNNISRIIHEFLKTTDFNNAEMHFEENDVIRMVIISDQFIGMRLVGRIATLSELFIDFQMNNLPEFNLIFNPLTINEKLSGKSGAAEGPTNLNNKNDGYAASTTY